MADNVQFQSTQLATPADGTQISTDEAASGHIQRVKLAYSADGVDTHVGADADGLLVNLGANNDVTVTGTVTANAGTGPFPVSDNGGSLTVDGTVAATQSGTWNLNNIGGTISLPTGAATEASLATANSNLLVIAGSIDNGVQDVGLRQTRISVQPTVSTTPAYTAKDAVGGKLTFTNAARTPGGTITIPTAIVVDLSQQQPALDLVLFDRDFTASTDNAAFDPTDADLANVVGVIPMTRWFDFNDNSVCVRTGLNLAAKLNTTDLFGQLVTRSTPTFVGTSDIRVILEIVQD